jgi:HEPN domain
MTRKDLQELSRLRLREAQALYKARLYDGCVYLAGYAVELALKARICRLLRVREYPLPGDIGRAFKVQSLEQLKVLAGPTTEIDVKRNKGTIRQLVQSGGLGSGTAVRHSRQVPMIGRRSPNWKMPTFSWPTSPERPEATRHSPCRLELKRHRRFGLKEINTL